MAEQAISRSAVPLRDGFSRRATPEYSPASAAALASRHVAAANVGMSVGVRPNSSVRAPSVAAAASGSPITSPAASSQKFWRSTIITICARVEPRDRRMPISLLRLTVRYAMMPYKPTVTSTIRQNTECSRQPRHHPFDEQALANLRLQLGELHRNPRIQLRHALRDCGRDSGRDAAGADDDGCPRVRTGVLRNAARRRSAASTRPPCCTSNPLHACRRILCCRPRR